MLFKVKPAKHSLHFGWHWWDRVQLIRHPCQCRINHFIHSPPRYEIKWQRFLSRHSRWWRFQISFKFILYNLTLPKSMCYNIKVVIVIVRLSLLALSRIYRWCCHIAVKYSNIRGQIGRFDSTNLWRCTVWQIHDSTSNIRIFEFDRVKIPFTESGFGIPTLNLAISTTRRSLLQAWMYSLSPVRRYYNYNLRRSDN